jgi:hypothetical protein
LHGQRYADFLYWKLGGDECPSYSPGVRVLLETFYGCPRVNPFASFCWYEALPERDSNASLYFLYSRLDTGISTYGLFCNKLELEPFAAFTYLYTRENLSSKEKTNYSGYGASLGCKIYCPLNACLSLFGQASYCGLYGELDVKQFYTSRSQENNYWRGRSLADFMIGIKASSHRQCSYRLYHILGWQYTYLIDFHHALPSAKKTADLSLQGLTWKWGVLF